VRLLPPNTYAADPALRSLLGAWLTPATREWAEPQLQQLGRLAAEELHLEGERCERQAPWLRAIDPWGERVDEVVYPEAWRRLGAVAARFGLAGMPYEEDSIRQAGAEARLVQAALCYLFEPQTATYLCPVSMTDAAARVLLDFGPEPLCRQFVPHLVSRDPEQAWTAGQWMTEQQGGSDVGANAVDARREEGGWRLYGRKYFCSNVGGELVLALARPEGAGPGTRGLGLFLVPRLLPGGGRNAYRIDRLKDKLGTRGMATGEVTLEGARAEPVGDLGRGFAQMTPMLNITRLHNAVASAASLRRGLQLALGYAATRRAFGRPLEQLPLQRQVLVEMAVRAEAALVLTMRQAALLGRLERGLAADEEKLLFRFGGSLVKLYTARLAVSGASEALEAFGGAGYMEDTGIARLLRDAQVLTIWEGTTNVLSLDVMRTVARPGVAAAYLGELERLGSPRRAALEQRLDWLSKQDEDLRQRYARTLAFEAAEAWVGGLLKDAAGRGSREAAIWELWAASKQPAADAELGADRFELVVDGPA
jgi:alkylation response protein AidB-like acyl-CoA dehydrogenase